MNGIREAFGMAGRAATAARGGDLGRWVGALVCLGVLGWGGAVQAAGYFRSDADLQELESVLRSRVPVGTALFVKGYVLGVADAGSGTQWCLPADLTEEHLFQAVARHLPKDPPPRTSRSAAQQVSEALSSEFPCAR
ncbi:MAG TPA: Rap1a/Tai family immunity protein [Zoogloea sp.]|uniref:Rap1a/Tai family immunity protein n=1 Tax=Zoogloea sp. TaxID=49181 RepID=UPI002CF9C4FE|nr:Rap1a/Tai family immunity protein [Zoogloea sp.]HMV18450.1 Rap1a/Tai family immunity protein [Rhodocyclaceae bacterium]HMV62271.1 Rap1a/Tai family immunity protein [Rhodocyclaceae bacterium]HMY49989.1 Rap1a/Tai family immunity protein [Rhodocyclaceae bacterium]HNA66319.1 Rap1a/Tai family immunity protein [Rhodocyclaceae bacterium]HNB63444.1 Rap1a/Tai family immunity protein [Rhodocyclaceae bacterium]